MRGETCLIIPSYNEGREAVECAYQILKTLPFIHKVIIVDDGSDNPPISSLPTIEILYNENNRGVGYAFIRGIQEALDQDYDKILCWTLIDRGLYPLDLLNIHTQLEDYEFVTGIRNSYKGENWLRRLGLWFHRVLFKLRTGVYLKDTTIGIRGFRATIFRGNPFIFDDECGWLCRYGFETALLMWAVKKTKWTTVSITTIPPTNSSIRLWGKNSFLSIYRAFFKKWN